MDKLVSAVVPCFNEGERILPVLDSLKKSKLCGEIIVVDDGSAKQTKDVLNKTDGIKLITHPQNRGKSQALKTGISHARLPYLAFIDSDLINFTGAHFDKLVNPVISGKCDITLSFRQKEAWYGLLSGFAVAYTGERCFQRELIQANISIFDNYGYLIEPEFNRRFFKTKKVRGVFFDNVGQVGQPQKNGLHGWLINLKQVKNYLLFLGPFEMLYQLFYVKRPSFIWR